MMRLLLILLQLTISTAYGSEEADRIHLVFDLDWTLISEVRPEEVYDPAQVIQADGKTYHVSENAVQTVKSLMKDPRVKISFFSGGSRIRNEATLRALGFYDLAYRVLSKEDMDEVAPLGALDPIPLKASLK